MMGLSKYIIVKKKIEVTKQIFGGLHSDEINHYFVAAGVRMQSTIINNYLIITQNGLSKIYSFPPTGYTKVLHESFAEIIPAEKSLIMKIPIVTPEEPEKLSKRIDNLILFS